MVKQSSSRDFYQALRGNARIDIIIPFHNDRATLARALASVAMQTIAEDVDVTLVDDSSDDSCEDILKAFSHLISLRVLHAPSPSGYPAERARLPWNAQAMLLLPLSMPTTRLRTLFPWRAFFPPCSHVPPAMSPAARLPPSSTNGPAPSSSPTGMTISMCLQSFTALFPGGKRPILPHGTELCEVQRGLWF